MKKGRSNPIDKYKELLSPHVDSFNWWLNEGLHENLKDLDPYYFRFGRDEVKREGHVWVDKPILSFPVHDVKAGGEVLPFECRLGHSTYEAKLDVTVHLKLDDGREWEQKKQIGPIPIMVRSEKCNLNKRAQDIVSRGKEEDRESGGYFVINGNEKLVRLLIAPKRHYPFVVERATLTKCGPTYTKYGCFFRSVRADGSGTSLQALYLSDGTIMSRLWINRKPFFIPLAVLMRACMPNVSDKEIYDRIKGDAEENDTFVLERLAALLNQGRKQGLLDQDSCLSLIGNEFRSTLSWLSQKLTPKEVGLYFMKKFILIHLDDGHEKLIMLCHMARKLYSLVRGYIREDNLDVLGAQELWTPGQIYGCVVKERIFGMLQNIAAHLSRSFSLPNADVGTKSWIQGQFLRSIVPIGNGVRTFLATGNFQAKFCSDYQQETGFVIMGEKLNMLRYTAHFRCVHRGAYFAQMKTTTVRKLLPDSWGFLCPVHTPDGAPCGLLNHLTADCKVTDGMYPFKRNSKALCDLLESFGVYGATRSPSALSGVVTVVTDGKVVGGIEQHLVPTFIDGLRDLKMNKSNDLVPYHMEIVYDNNERFPCISLFTTGSRFIREVLCLRNGKPEWIGPMEQPYLEIAADLENLTPETQYVEHKATGMLSLVAQLTPFSDFNQSPRNMYQCQMGKQTMGIPVTNFDYRADNKMYRLTYGQSPAVKTDAHVSYGMDDYPNGINAVVAVLAYTGYDMEDAMIINKSSYERGLGHACVYYGMRLDLKELAKQQGLEANDLYFDNSTNNEDPKLAHIDKDGLPMPGTKLATGDVLARYYNCRTGSHQEVKNKKIDLVIVDCVIPVAKLPDRGIWHVMIKLREPRNPIIGDKFSSRHGQKGTLSKLWPQEDMPFSDSGITPDILINPHAFPSRMTIGMLMESMAGKAGALHGKYQNGTPFQFSEDNKAVDNFGKQLLSAGYSYYGSESMYSGIYGTEMKVDIFMGVVFYQRLRHMVSDKFQVRALGALNQLTKQPVGGRKVGGGIRFGEMERDSLLAHGASFLINERTFLSSDYSKCFCCVKCGSIISAVLKKEGKTCTFCKTGDHISYIAIPYVFRYLAVEFAAFSIRCNLTMKQIGQEKPEN